MAVLLQNYYQQLRNFHPRKEKVWCLFISDSLNRLAKGNRSILQAKLIPKGLQ